MNIFMENNEEFNRIAEVFKDDEENYGSDTFGPVGLECQKEEVEAIIRVNRTLFDETGYYGSYQPKTDFTPIQFKCGCHVSVLDPYPEGA